jgi:adenylate cyclase
VSEEALRQRLAAILAADAAGYSYLMAADERGTVASLDAARSVFRTHIESNHGRVVDMAGDSVLAVFDTASGAASAALAVQRELEAALSTVPEQRRMRFRIGIHLGDVVEKTDGSVYGDGVNVAARLQGLADPGGITVSDAIRSALRGKLGAGLEDLGEQRVKNIVEPVCAYRLETENAVAPPPKRSVADIDLSLPERPSIAVLPFINMSSDPEQGYFSDGVSEDIITELSRFRSLFVIARNSSFSYKGKSPDVRKVGQELGVRYVLEGSIRKAANRIRVAAQLVDSLTGGHIWAEKYDRLLEDVFAVQEELTRSIVVAIAPQIDAAELQRARRRRPESLSAYEIAVRASAKAWDALIRSDRALRDEAIAEARQALAVDARSRLALWVIAFAQWQHLLFRSAPDPGAAFDDGLAAAGTAIAEDGSESEIHAAKAMLLAYAPERPRWEESLANARRAYDLNPNSIQAQLALGQIEAFAGDARRSIEALDTALRTSPRDPLLIHMYQGLAMASWMRGEYASGVEYGLRGAILAPEFPIILAHLAVNYVGLGDIDKAKEVFSKAYLRGPSWCESKLRGDFPYRRREDVQRVTTFMRIAAGLEDPSAGDSLR